MSFFFGLRRGEKGDEIKREKADENDLLQQWCGGFLVERGEFVYDGGGFGD